MWCCRNQFDGRGTRPANIPWQGKNQFYLNIGAIHVTTSPFNILIQSFSFQALYVLKIYSLVDSHKQGKVLFLISLLMVVLIFVKIAELVTGNSLPAAVLVRQRNGFLHSNMQKNR
jgi:hypothetical protein